MKDYLELLSHVDLCLDTFPYSGGTTTLHALWMGVPTLTLAGKTLPSWVGSSLMSRLGLEAFVANTRMEFFEKGLSWVGRLTELAKIRGGLRERFGPSSIGQPALVAASLESALRVMWRRWCSGLPPESFEVECESSDQTKGDARTWQTF